MQAVKWLFEKAETPRIFTGNVGKIPFSLHALNKYLNQLVLIYVIFLISLEIISSFCAK